MTEIITVTSNELSRIICGLAKENPEDKLIANFILKKKYSLKDKRCYIIEENGRAVAGIAIDPSIHSLFVVEECRGKGYGKKLIEFALTKVDPVDLIASDMSRPIFEKFGFKVVNTTKSQKGFNKHKMVRKVERGE